MLTTNEIKRLRSLMTRKDDRLPIIFNALSDPNRCKIFRTFLKRNKLCVSDISKTLGISMSLASQHLKVLEITGLLLKERQGRIAYFVPNSKDKLVSGIIRSVND